MTEAAIHTVELTTGHFACIVLSRPDMPSGAIAFMDRDDVEAHITLLRNAMDRVVECAPIELQETILRGIMASLVFGFNAYIPELIPTVLSTSKEEAMAGCVKVLP